MSIKQQAIAGVARPPLVARPRRHTWRGALRHSEFAWAIAFAVPYAVLFLAFVLYPIIYGIWMGSQPALYAQLFDSPIYLTALLNTLIFVGVGVNLKMALAFLLSGFF